LKLRKKKEKTQDETTSRIKEIIKNGKNKKKQSLNQAFDEALKTEARIIKQQELSTKRHSTEQAP